MSEAALDRTQESYFPTARVSSLVYLPVTLALFSPGQEEEILWTYVTFFQINPQNLALSPCF
jgi:hypothetical protein